MLWRQRTGRGAESEGARGKVDGTILESFISVSVGLRKKRACSSGPVSFLVEGGLGVKGVGGCGIGSAEQISNVGI